MYSLATFSTLLATALAAATRSPGAVNYDGYKVVRIPTGSTGDNLVSIQNIIDDLRLRTLEHPTVQGANVDIMVPPDQVNQFDEKSKGLEVQVLHEDLGADIAGEGEMGAYEGIFSVNHTSAN